MKKKVLSALLCAAMAVSMLAGCGGSKSDSKEADKSATESTKAASDTFTFAPCAIPILPPRAGFPTPLTQCSDSRLPKLWIRPPSICKFRRNMRTRWSI